MKKGLYIKDENLYIKMKIKAWWGVGFLFLIFAVFAFYSYGEIAKNIDSIVGLDNKLNNSTDSIITSIEGILNNKDFSKVSENISHSTILVQIKKDSFQIGEQASGGVLVEEDGSNWGKGTAFSIGNGLLITAYHVIESVDYGDIKINWEGIDYTNSVINVTSVPSADFAIIKTNLSIPPVNIVNNGVPIGAKIGFIGYPLNEKIQILHDGVISSVRVEPDGFFWYTINSFVNRGNSGGPVFLSDTGEVVGMISSRQNEQIGIPQIVDETKLSEGEKMLYQMLVFMSIQLASNSQVGIGQIIGINQGVVDNIKKDIN